MGIFKYLKEDYISAQGAVQLVGGPEYLKARYSNSSDAYKKVVNYLMMLRIIHNETQLPGNGLDLQLYIKQLYGEPINNTTYIDSHRHESKPYTVEEYINEDIVIESGKIEDLQLYKPKEFKHLSGYHNSWGKSKKDNKFYGYSHRAKFGFKPGQKVKKDTIGNIKPGKEWIIKNEEEAAKMAINFANGVA